jgi:uncharacterized membrane protein YuzA (DUF378 family)
MARRPNPLLVILYIISDFGALVWLVYAVTQQVPHELLGLSASAGTVIYTIVGLLGVISLVATGQKLAK